MRTNRRAFLRSTLAAAAVPVWSPQAVRTPDGSARRALDARIRLVRNATCRIQYGDKTLLLDPWLGDVGSYPAIRNVPDPRPNPLVGLPMPVAEVLAGVDAILLTHTHFDHWDTSERNRVLKSATVFVQPADKERLAREGFTGVRAVTDALSWEGILITPTPAQHGRGEMATRMGPVTGYVLSRSGLPTIYLAGDTVWFDGVAAALAGHRPDVIVVHAGEARFAEGGAITMGVDDVVNVCRAAPRSTVIAVHMEAVNHCVLSRGELKSFAAANHFVNRLFVPRDGETLTL